MYFLYRFVFGNVLRRIPAPTLTPNRKKNRENGRGGLMGWATPTKPRPPGPSEPGGTKTIEEKEECHNHFFILQILLSVLKWMRLKSFQAWLFYKLFFYLFYLCQILKNWLIGKYQYCIMFVFGPTIKTWPCGPKFAFIHEIYIWCDYFFFKNSQTHFKNLNFLDRLSMIFWHNKNNKENSTFRR